MLVVYLDGAGIPCTGEIGAIVVYEDAEWSGTSVETGTEDITVAEVCVACGELPWL